MCGIINRIEYHFPQAFFFVTTSFAVVVKDDMNMQGRSLTLPYLAVVYYDYKHLNLT